MSIASEGAEKSEVAQYFGFLPFDDVMVIRKFEPSSRGEKIRGVGGK